jgi:hypothetical protein
LKLHRARLAESLQLLQYLPGSPQGLPQKRCQQQLALARERAQVLATRRVPPQGLIPEKKESQELEQDTNLSHHRAQVLE